MLLSDLECRVCGAGGLHEVAGYSDLARVTSDCKPFAPGGRLAICTACGAVQKPKDLVWEREAAAIYGGYEPYYQSGGIEQAVFDPEKGEPRLRSDVMLDRLSIAHSLPETGTLLDVGCGNGVFLSAFARRRPGWQLHGHELSDLHLAALSLIPGFQKLHTGELEALPAAFDVITMIHALEHFAEPLAALKALRQKLREDGVLFIEVPNGAATPFDLLIADHLSHFTRHDLARLLKRADLGAAVVADDWITKELSAVAVPGMAEVSLPPALPAQKVIERVGAQIGWLRHIIEDAREAAKGAQSFGLFGSSVAAMWLYGQLSDDVAFFVDEDPNRETSTIEGRPILRPDQVPLGATVFVTLIPHVARAVAGRLRRPGVDYRIPPDIG